MEGIQKVFEDRYLLIKKNQWYYLLGGMVGVLVSIFAISWAGTRAGLFSLKARKAMEQIEANAVRSSNMTAHISALKLESNAIVERLRAKLEETVRLAFQSKEKRELNTWHQAEADGFALIVVGGAGNGASGHLSVDKSKRKDGLSAFASGYDSHLLIVRKGEYYVAEKDAGEGSVYLYWIPLFQVPK